MAPGVEQVVSSCSEIQLAHPSPRGAKSFGVAIKVREDKDRPPGASPRNRTLLLEIFKYRGEHFMLPTLTKSTWIRM
jgi:hypothetical protein